MVHLRVFRDGDYWQFASASISGRELPGVDAAPRMIEQWDFGDAIVWQSGFVRDDEVRTALRVLFDEGLLIEHAAAFELTEAGEAAVAER
jgi:hypothetical protein